MKLLLILFAFLSLGKNTPDRLYTEVPIQFQGVISTDSLINIVDEWELESVALVGEDSVFVIGEYTVLEPYPPRIEIEVVESPDTHVVMKEPEVTLGDSIVEHPDSMIIDPTTGSTDVMLFPDTCSRRGSSDLGDEPNGKLTKQEAKSMFVLLGMAACEPPYLPNIVFEIDKPIVSKWQWMIIGAIIGAVITCVIGEILE